MEIRDWIDQNKLTVNWIDDDLFRIGEDLFFHLKSKTLLLEDIEKEVIINNRFEFQYTDDEIELIQDNEIKYVVFEFGSFFYYSTPFDVKLNIFKYLGQSKEDLKMDFPFLGIHGGYELCNGSRSYKDWIKKAKFLGYSTIGICEENTLAGTLAFQTTCEKEKINFIHGETITILLQGNRVNIKLYVLNEKGWQNLLRINNFINTNIVNEVVDKVIPFEEIRFYKEGLACILTPEVELNTEIVSLFQGFDQLYYQVDFLEWSSNDRDYSWLMNLKLYFDSFFHILPPILICDAYYLDQEDYKIKRILNKIGNVGFKPQSENQFFKSSDDIYLQMSTLFKSSDERVFDIFLTATESLKTLSTSCSFAIKTGNLYLPQYQMTAEEATQFETNDQLFYHLIDKGFNERLRGKVEDEEVYIDRIAKEIAVIKKGGFIDYFLIIADIFKWCLDRGYWVGLGRGSAAGSLVSYCMNLTGIDPIVYDLLFERFLNEGRLKSGLPDFDSDLPVKHRAEIKQYIRDKYGENSVTGIGTYTSLKLKAGVKALNREFGVDPQKSNYISAMLEAEGDYTSLFKEGSKSPQLKEFIQQYPQIIEKLPLLMNQPGNSSIHAAGIVITPKFDSNGTPKTVYDWMPVKKMDGIITSEWEGTYIDKMGFLKCDILGLEQLDKFMRINELVRKHYNVDVRYDDINLDEKGVYELFQNGNNEDVFQFTGYGLRKYCQDLHPENINDLIATNALYRPGPIDMGAHVDYVKIKNGEKEPQYDYLIEDVTKPTYGLFVYQEQIMAAVQKIANFTLVEADDIRKAMGKIIPELIQSYGSKFIEGAIANGCPPEEAQSIWDKLVRFGAYSYNKSHAACYAIMGYFSQWFKYKYPLEFWTTSLEFSEADELIQKVAEINTLGQVSVSPVDINKSKDSFYPDPENNTIYWSLNSIKWVGSSAVDEITHWRDEDGQYFSFEEFYSRVERRKVNKRSMEHLIYAGAFDEIENIQNLTERYRLLEQYYVLSKNEKLIPDIAEQKSWPEYKWILKQKELTGFGYIDFKKIINLSSFKTQISSYLSGEDLEDETLIEKEKIVGGVIKNLIERKSRRGPFVQIELENNFNTIFVTCWNESYETYRQKLNDGKNQVLFLKGKVVKDNYKGKNVIHTTENTVLSFL
jgi:DNA polymerase-3 subunit alpha